MLLLLPQASLAGIPEGIQFLKSQIQQEGSYVSGLDIATPYQSTAEVLDTFHIVNNSQQPSSDLSLQFLQNEPYQGTEYLSRLIIAKAEQGQVDIDLINQLQSYQNQDGGFGEFSGYNSTVIDTLFAAQAFAITEKPSTKAAGFAISYLQANQNQAGYFSLHDNEASVYITALAAQTFSAYRYIYAVSDNIFRANNYLLTHISANGASDELFETAAMLSSLVPVTADTIIYQPLVDHLLATQQSNGAWLDDVFTTAIIIKALHTQKTAAPLPGLAVLYGAVKEEGTNTPLNNVNVTLTTSDGQVYSTITDIDGHYLISNIIPGNVSITFEVNGYYPVNSTVMLIAGEVLSYNTNLQVNPLANPIQITGQVIDAVTLLPITDAIIHVLNSTFSVQSDSQGGFNIFNIPAGSATVEVTKNGYQTQLFSISAAAGGTVDLGDVTLNLVTNTSKESSLSGMMIDAITGEPLRGVLISISGMENLSTYTKQDGQFLITNIIPGNVVVTASLDGYLNATGDVFLLGGTNLQFNASLVKISNPALVTLQGQVADTKTQLPLLGVNVVLGTGHMTKTDGNGRFYLSGIESGSIRMEFSLAGYNTVSYAINADSGSSINLASIALAQMLPVSGNKPPVILSTAPEHAVVGQVYEYHPKVIDPEGSPLIFGLSGNPGRMDINDLTGVIRWIPTTEQVGKREYTLLISDSEGAIALQTVSVIVTNNIDPSYVITDVETLNALTIDALLPSNYLLGSHVRGARPGTWRATSPQGCGFSYAGGGVDSSSITAAANSLDFWSMGSGFGADGIWDLGEALASVTVLPLIDHGPFPQEGIEYTIWGSNDPDATFPEGWSLATLVTIYSQGWADNAAVCGGGVNIDDYAGLYTFAQKQYRYIRLKADNSITIFDTPKHIKHNAIGDDSSLPGWQSVESEIDGVVGMVCNVSPEANAGIDILGKTRDIIVFDGTGSQGNIVTYGWDIDNDSEIDLIGDLSEHTFNAGFDGDVTLFVVDDKGCVGTDTVHVTIGLNYPKPDLIVSTIDSANVATHLQTLSISGSVTLTITNQGNAPATQAAEVTVFEDRNFNGQYDLDIDNELGTQSMPSGLAKGDKLTMAVVVIGTSLFRDSPIMAMVDSNRQVDESEEDNNLVSSASRCKVDPAVGSFDAVLKWEWNGSSILSSHNQVMSIPIVAPIEDTNNDGVIDGLDAPGVIFHTFSGSNHHSDGVLRAVSGIDGHELWTVSDLDYRTTPQGSIAVADIDLDGMVEIIAPKNGGGIIVFEHTGEFKWQSTIPQQIFWGGTSIADLDNDGSPEIIVGNTVLRNDGTLYWQWSGYWGSSSASVGGLPIAVDLNLDGFLEVISGASAYSNTGQLLWRNETIGDGFLAVANFDGDDYPEIVVVASGHVSLLNHDGTVIWGPVTLPGGGTGGAPIIADMNGDGNQNIGVAGARRYTVFSSDGSILWSKVISDTSSLTGSSVFDFDGDGDAEVVYNDEYFLRVYKGSDGEELFATPNTSGTTYELPVIADIDKDNHADIVVCSNSYAFGGATGIRVYEDRKNTWMPTRSIWNQHSYHITNINDDGTIPQFERPSWLTHNSYRLNTFTDRDPALLTDITASVLTIQDNGNMQPASISVRIGNAGSGALVSEIGIAFYQGDPANKGQLLGIVAINNLAQGDYQDIQLNNIDSLTAEDDIYVIADYDNRLPECNETNNRVTLPVLPQTSTGEILVASNQLVYGPDSPVQFQLSVTNSSGVAGEFKTSLQLEDPLGNIVQVYPTHQIGPLAGGVNIALPELWHTAKYQAGNYILIGKLFNLRGEVINEASSTFEIRHSINGEPLATLRTNTDKPIYNISDVVQIFNLTKNLTINQIIDDASIEIIVNDPSGTSVFTETASQATLLSGASKSITTIYSLSNAAEGIYTVTSRLVSSTGILLANGTTQFEVQADLKQLLTGTVSAQLETLDQGQLQTCTDTLSFKGATDLLGQPVRQLLVNIDSAQVIHTHEISVDLINSKAYSTTREITTSNLQLGVYACILQGKVNKQWITIANDSFILTAPPINIQSHLNTVSEGRLLVLLDSSSGHKSNCDDKKESKSSDDDEDHDDKDDDDECDDDNLHHISNTPSLARQQAYLETLLTDNQKSYTLVTDTDAFTREFRTGSYTRYVLFSKQEKLAEQVQQELREAIFRGDGLLLAGGHDHRHNKLETTLGLKFKGELKHTEGIDIQLSSFPLTGSSDWMFDGNAVKVSTQGAQVLAYYLGSSQMIALTRHRYGEGHSVFAGFDLLAQASQINAAPLFAELILASIQEIKPETTNTVVGAPVAMRLDLINMGIATPGQAMITIPDDTTILDAGLAQQVSNRLFWTFDLATENTVESAASLNFWLKLPAVEGNIEISSLIQVGTTPNLTDYTHLDLILDIDKAATLQEILQRPELQQKAYKKIREDIEKAQEYLDKGQNDKALKYAIKATDHFDKKTLHQSKTIRLQLDHAIRVIAQQL